MAQQMLQQQQPQQLQMLVAFPEWNGQDAESHISQLDSALHANGQAGILDQPQRYFHLLLTTCKTQRMATEFIHFHMRQHPESSTKVIKDAFMERFQSEVRNNAAKARDAFYSRQIRMSMGMSVQDYASLFRQQMVHIPEMHENDRICWFHSGLTPQLRTECIVDMNGNDFTTVEALIKFAVGQERRNLVMQQTNPSEKRALVSADDNNSAKKVRFSDNTDKKCYNCRKVGHLAKDCPNKD
jgi:hypothetical protein